MTSPKMHAFSILLLIFFVNVCVVALVPCIIKYEDLIQYGYRSEIAYDVTSKCKFGDAITCEWNATAFGIICFGAKT